MKVKKILAFILAAIMIMAVVAGCTPGDNKKNEDTTAATEEGTIGDVGTDPFYDEDNITLKVWGPDLAKDILKDQCDAFIAKYPEKNITIEVLPQSESDAGSKVLADPDTAADVFGFPSDQLDMLVNAGVLAPVFENENAVANLSAEVIKSWNDDNSVEAATMDGILYAFPETSDNGYMLFYDKRVVSDEQAKTLEGIFEAAKAANRKFIMDAGTGFYSCIFPFTGGLRLEGTVDDVQQFNDYDEDKVVATMKAFGTLFREYSEFFTSVDAAQVISGLEQQTCAAGIDGVWHAADAVKNLGENIGFAKLPTIKVNGTDEQIISMQGYKFIGVKKASKFPESAQLLAAYLTSEEAQLARAEKIMWGPSNKVAAASDVVKNSPSINAILEQGKHSVAQISVSQTFWEPMGGLGSYLINKEKSLEDADLKKLLSDTIVNIKDE